jgi:hypothetical protein
VDGSLKIPTAVPAQAGGIGYDTSRAPALLVGTSTNASYPAVLPLAPPIRWNLASTTWTSTSTAQYTTLDFKERVVSGICYTNAGTVLVRVGNGTTWSNAVSVGTATTSVTFTSGNLFQQNGEKIIFQVGSPASSPQQANCAFRMKYEI